MSNFAVAMDLSGTPEGKIAALEQRLADMGLELEDTRRRLEASEMRANELEDEKNELKDAHAEIDADDPDALTIQYVDDEADEDYEDCGIDSAEDYDAVVRAQAKVLEANKKTTMADHRALIAEMKTNQLIVMKDSLVEENTKQRADLIEFEEIIKAIKGERDSYKASPQQDRAALLQKEYRIAKGRIAKDRKGHSRHFADVSSLAVRQKQIKEDAGEGTI